MSTTSKTGVVLLVVVIIIGGYVWWQGRATDTSMQGQQVSTTTSSTGGQNPASNSTGSSGSSSTYSKYTITLTSNGFSPQTVHVTAGQSLHFVNGTTLSMRVYSKSGQGSTVYTGFDQNKSVGKGGTFDIVMDRPGSWTYYNLDNPKATGLIIVDPQ